MTAKHPPIETIRVWFPGLASGFAYLDNAGGSQVPYCVADAIRDYMLHSYAQLGADYPASRRASQTVAEAHDVVTTLMGGQGAGKVILGASTSGLMRMLANCYGEALAPGDEVIVGMNGHESNINPWLSLQPRGIKVRRWEANPETGVCELAALRALLSERTKVVAFVHVSNILGGIEDIGPCVEAAHAAGARVVVDGVAYAPHLAMDVARWGVDWYVYSTYKVFGPHMAALFGTHAAMERLSGPNHPWVKDAPARYELGGVSHEGCAGLVALKPFLNFVAGKPEGAPFDRQSVERAFATIEALEQPLLARLLAFLESKRDVRLWGPRGGKKRVAVVSFTHSRRRPAELLAAAIDANVGIKSGHFYSRRLVERLGIEPDAGVARVSLAHYNTAEEVDRLISALDPLL